MRIKLLFIFCLIHLSESLLAQQWQVLKKFSDMPSKILPIGDSLLVCAGDKIYATDRGFFWSEFSMKNYPGYEILNTINGVYFVFDKKIFQFNFYNNPYIGSIDTSGQLYASGKDIVVAYEYPARSAKITLRQYNTATGTKTILPAWGEYYYGRDRHIVGNDSVLLMGFGFYSGNGYGINMLDQKMKVWSKFTSSQDHLQNYILNTMNLHGNEFSAIEGKGCEAFFLTTDFGKTYIHKNLPGSFFGKCWNETYNSILRNLGSDHIFIGNNKSKGAGVWKTGNNGDTWDEILKDTVIINAEVLNNTLYALTEKGTLLSYGNTVITSGTDGVDMTEGETLLFYTEKSLVNRGKNILQYSISDLSGRIIMISDIIPDESIPVNLGPGMYILYSGNCVSKFYVR